MLNEQPKSQREFEENVELIDTNRCFDVNGVELEHGMVAEEDIAEVIETKVLLEQLRASLRELPTIQRRLICMRYGLTTKTHTIEQTARRMGLSLDDVELLERQALNRLKQILEK